MALTPTVSPLAGAVSPSAPARTGLNPPGAANAPAPRRRSAACCRAGADATFACRNERRPRQPRHPRWRRRCRTRGTRGAPPPAARRRQRRSRRSGDRDGSTLRRRCADPDAAAVRSACVLLRGAKDTGDDRRQAVPVRGLLVELPATELSPAAPGGRPATSAAGAGRWRSHERVEM